MVLDDAEDGEAMNFSTSTREASRSCGCNPSGHRHASGGKNFGPSVVDP